MVAAAALLLVAACGSDDDASARRMGFRPGFHVGDHGLAERHGNGRCRCGPGPAAPGLRRVALPASWGITGSGLVGSFSLPGRTTRSYTLPAATGLSGTSLRRRCRQPGLRQPARLSRCRDPGRVHARRARQRLQRAGGRGHQQRQRHRAYLDLSLASSSPWNAGGRLPERHVGQQRCHRRAMPTASASSAGRPPTGTTSVNPPNPTASCPAPLHARRPRAQQPAQLHRQRPGNGGTVTYVFKGFTPGSSN